MYLLSSHFNLQKDWTQAAANNYIKYGDIAWPSLRAEAVLMKQKHRLIYERRHGSLPTHDGFKLATGKKEEAQ